MRLKLYLVKVGFCLMACLDLTRVVLQTIPCFVKACHHFRLTHYYVLIVMYVVPTLDYVDNIPFKLLSPFTMHKFNCEDIECLTISYKTFIPALNFAGGIDMQCGFQSV